MPYDHGWCHGQASGLLRLVNIYRHHLYSIHQIAMPLSALAMVDYIN